MPRTNIAVQTPKGPYTTVTAGLLKATMTAADVSSGNSFSFSGHEVVIIQNTDSADHTVTLTSSPDEHGRTGDITTYNVPAGEIHVFSFRGGTAGWVQTGSKGFLNASDATIKFAILSLA